ncbi:collagen-like protein [Pseudoalteromonas sp. MMG013]|uniref:collagen-like triple helix repeat-containing protein n=1 Tax=Pseudoalteromonas sp. MMG013 TaxID=2822687 RepID=UPI001B3774E7|nr:collagen-like protein [Pseudoalteromonas sp. MMG013]MBQ4863956.1 collagen-like protein [Pseudoalteromonas sp. MMG013]
MKNLITLAILSVGAISFQSAANEQESDLALSKIDHSAQVELNNLEQAEFNDIVFGPHCCYENPGQPGQPGRPGCQGQPGQPGFASVSDAEMLAAAQPSMLSAPIYIGGARYTLTKSNFNPVYETRVIYDPCYFEPPRTYRQLVGYEVSFPVDGDFGQDLIYDLVGRSNKSMSLSASCGSFSGSDSGSKYVISTRKNTGGSCKNMHVKFRFTGSAPSYINLNVTISEEI